MIPSVHSIAKYDYISGINKQMPCKQILTTSMRNNFAHFNTRTNSGFYNLYLPMHLKEGDIKFKLTRFRGLMMQDQNK